MKDRDALEAVKHAALWFEPGLDGLAPLVDAVGNASVVLIGEATHGTSEFYRIRAELTAALIEHKGFNIVAAEADWPDAYRVNRWVRHMSADPDAATALSDFTRFPRWMWRNDVVVDFLSWLHSYNEGRQVVERCGWYGLDLYSLHRSMEAVLEYLNRVDPEAARRARDRYACFGQRARKVRVTGTPRVSASRGPAKTMS
jgi:erythromycin esterase-like protein